MNASSPSEQFPLVSDPSGATTVLSADACWELLATADVARLAVYAAGDLDVFPVNVVVDDRTLVFRTAEGTKLVELVLAGRCAMEADGYDIPTGDAWSVVVKGQAQLLDRFDDVYRAQELPLFPWNSAPKGQFVRVVPRVVSGRRFRVAARPPAD